MKNQSVDARMTNLTSRLHKLLEFKLCEISKTNNQFKHGRRNEYNRLKPLLDLLPKLVEALEPFKCDSKSATGYEKEAYHLLEEVQLIVGEIEK